MLVASTSTCSPDANIPKERRQWPRAARIPDAAALRSTAFPRETRTKSSYHTGGGSCGGDDNSAGSRLFFPMCVAVALLCAGVRGFVVSSCGSCGYCIACRTMCCY